MSLDCLQFTEVVLNFEVTGELELGHDTVNSEDPNQFDDKNLYPQENQS